MIAVTSKQCGSHGGLYRRKKNLCGGELLLQGLAELLSEGAAFVREITAGKHQLQKKHMVKNLSVHADINTHI